jgi:hypothetical protein
MARERAAIVRQARLEGLDAEDATLGADGAADFDLATDKRIEKRARRAEGLGSKWEIAEEFLERRFAWETDRADTADAIEDGEAFEEIVNLIEAYGKVDAGAGRGGTGVRELGETDARQHNAAERQFIGCGGLRDEAHKDCRGGNAARAAGLERRIRRPGETAARHGRS